MDHVTFIPTVDQLAYTFGGAALRDAHQTGNGR